MTKISDNQSYTNLLNEIKGLKLASYLLPDEKEELLYKLSLIEEQINVLRFTPDKFNQYYSELGWIAYESMNYDLMKNAIILAEDNKREEGEQLLIDFYTSNDNTKYMLTSLRNRYGFKNRYELLTLAYDDYTTKRYHGCIPVFLMIIDGVVDEVTKSNKGFFASDFNPRLWNSIVGHKSGLSKIAKIYASTRKKVNTTPITLPYRNGILHGKDINYYNIMVATKCLATIFALGDWVTQYESGKHIKPAPPKPQNFLQELKDLFATLWKRYEETEKIKTEIDNWQPRQISKEYINNINLNREVCINNSPEKKLVEFMTYFSKKNYGMLHDIIARHFADKSKGQYIQNIKSFIGNFSLHDYKIVSIKDCSPAISEIIVKIDIIDESNKLFSLATECRLIYQKDAFNTSVLVSGNPDGQWFVMDFFINEIYNQYWSVKISNAQL